jgi:hypothetical protein
MPCGGIYPIEESVGRCSPDSNASRCFVCNGVGSDLWVEEWDSGIHRKCIMRFLSSPEGKVVLDHGHSIYLPEIQRKSQ